MNKTRLKRKYSKKIGGIPAIDEQNKIIDDLLYNKVFGKEILHPRGNI